LGDRDLIETNRDQSLIGLNLFTPSLRRPQAPHKPRSIAERVVLLQ